MTKKEVIDKALKKAKELEKKKIESEEELEEEDEEFKKESDELGGMLDPIEEIEKMGK